MAVEVGRGLGTEAGAPAIDIVARDEGVDGTDIHVVGIARLHRVLEQRLEAIDDVFESLHALDISHELIHRPLALGQFHLAVLIPKSLVAHLGIGLGDLVLLAAEYLVGHFVEGILRETGDAGDEGAGAEKLEELELGHHVVLGEHPLAVGQFLIFLRHLQILHEVDVALLGDGELAAAQVERGVLEDIEVAAEAHVLHVVGQKGEMDATVHADGQCVFYIKAVEADACLGHGRGEGALQNADVVLVEVHIGKDILYHGVDDVARLEIVVDAR